MLALEEVERALRDAGFNHIDRCDLVLEAEALVEGQGKPQINTKYEVSVTIDGSLDVIRTRGLEGMARTTKVGPIDITICGHSQDVTEFTAVAESTGDVIGILAWIRNERDAGARTGTRPAPTAAPAGAVAAVAGR